MKNLKESLNEGIDYYFYPYLVEELTQADYPGDIDRIFEDIKDAIEEALEVYSEFDKSNKKIIDKIEELKKKHNF